MYQKRVQELIEELQMLPHPEGGFYSETFRSEGIIPATSRNYLTSIYFLLVNDHVSRFHRILSDECWYFHEGSPLIVHAIQEDGTHREHLLGLDFQGGERPFAVIPGNTIFGSHLKDLNGYALVSCAVAPGFDFADFYLFTRKELLEKYPQHRAIIELLSHND